MTKIALVAGSYDPVTLGHLWVLRQGLRMFDQVYVLITDNPTKKRMFSPGERSGLIRESALLYMSKEDIDNRVVIDILPPTQMTVSYAKVIGATHIIRGIRNTTDFEYENQLNLINKTIAPDIETIFILPPRELIEVSPSLVKGLTGLQGWREVAKNYVPPPVVEALAKKLQ
jgi:pantetheine-phosphate adenylyltransferase